MEKKYYFDKKNGLIILLSVLFFILPIYVLLIRYCLVTFFYGMDFIKVEDADVLGRALRVIGVRVIPITVIAGVGWFIIFLLKFAYLFLHSITIDNEGITSRFFVFDRKHFSWNEVLECGIGWEFDRIPQNNKPLPEGKEKFVHERNRDINTIKCIFFSTKKLSDTEKLEIFYGQQKKKYLIAVRYSQELYDYLSSTGRILCNERMISKQFQESERFQDKYIKRDEKYKVKQFADKKTGILYLCLVFVALGLSFVSVKGIEKDGFNYGIFWFSLYLITAVIWLVAAIIYARFAQTCLRVITVNYKGVTIKPIFGCKKIWSWEQIKDCGVIRDNSSKMERRMIKDQRYIFFSIKPFYLYNDQMLIKQYKRKDVIFVLYSEELYLYLNELGVMNY